MFTEDQYQTWLKFLDSFHAQYGQIPEDYPVWPLDILPKAAQPPQPTTIVTHVSKKIEDLHAAEITSPPQVP